MRPISQPNRSEPSDWQRALGAEGFRVGIAWRGNPKAPGPSRAIPLDAFRRCRRIPGVRLISLQKNGVEATCRLPEGMTVETLGADFDGGADAFLDTAAVMMSLDLGDHQRHVDRASCRRARAAGLDRDAACDRLALDGAGRGDAVVFDRARVQAGASRRLGWCVRPHGVGACADRRARAEARHFSRSQITITFTTLLLTLGCGIGGLSMNSRSPSKRMKRICSPPTQASFQAISTLVMTRPFSTR